MLAMIDRDRDAERREDEHAEHDPIRTGCALEPSD
jgi:hypothetical protein